MQHAGTPEYYEAMRLRKIWCEGNFSHQKERHNLRRTRKRGIERVTEQCLLLACALNLKRLVEILFLLQYSVIIPVRKLFGLFFIVKIPVCQQHHNRMPLILDKENVKEWIRPDGDPGIIVEKALSNMAFEKAVKYHRSPMEFITVQKKRSAALLDGSVFLFTLYR